MGICPIDTQVVDMSRIRYTINHMSRKILRLYGKPRRMCAPLGVCPVDIELCGQAAAYVRALAVCPVDTRLTICPVKILRLYGKPRRMCAPLTVCPVDTEIIAVKPRRMCAPLTIPYGC